MRNGKSGDTPSPSVAPEQQYCRHRTTTKWEDASLHHRSWQIPLSIWAKKALPKSTSLPFAYTAPSTKYILHVRRHCNIFLYFFRKNTDQLPRNTRLFNPDEIGITATTLTESYTWPNIKFLLTFARYLIASFVTTVTAQPYAKNSVYHITSCFGSSIFILCINQRSARPLEL